MSGWILNDDLPLLMFNIAAAGVFIGIAGLVLGRVLKKASAPVQHGVMLATLLLLFTSPGLTVLFAHNGLSWFHLTDRRDPESEAPSKPQTEEQIEPKRHPVERPEPETVPAIANPIPGPSLKTPRQERNRESASSVRKTNAFVSKPITPQVEAPPIEPAEPRFFPPDHASPAKNISASSPAELKPAESESAVKPPIGGPAPVRAFSIWASILACVWLAGAVVCSVRWVRAWRLIRQLMRSRTVIDDPRVLRAAASAAKHFGPRFSFDVFASRKAPVPLSLGLWKGSIVMPEGLSENLSDSELRDVFLHEAAHLARRDAWVGLLGQLAWVFWWWNLPLYAVNRRLARLREQICDSYVLAHGGDGRAFAETLIRIAEWSVDRSPISTLATSLLSSVEELTLRMAHLTRGDSPMAVRLNKKMLVLLILFATGFGTLCSWPLVGAEGTSTNEPKASPVVPAENKNDPEVPSKQDVIDKEKLHQENIERLVGRLRNATDEEERIEINAELQQEKLNLQFERNRKEREKRARDERLMHLQAILNVLTERMAKGGTTGERLFGGLARLQAASSLSDPDLYEPMRVLVNWRSLLEQEFPGKNDAIRPEEVARLIKEAEGGEALKKYREVEAEYRKLAGKPPRTDWSADAERWHQFASDFFSAGRGEELGKRWEKHIEDDPKRTSLYGLAYLEQIRLRKPSVANKEILKKFHAADPKATEPQVPTGVAGPAWRMTRFVLVLSAWDAAGLPREDEYRQSLWDDLLKLVKEKLLRVTGEQYRVLVVVLHEFWNGLSKEDQTDFVNAMLEDPDRFLVQVFPSLAGVPRAVLRRWFLTKTVEVEFVSTPFLDGLDYLMDVSPVTVWLDPKVEDFSEKEVTMDLRGRWLDALDQYLTQSPFESLLLEDGIVWIGPAEKRKTVEKRYREVLAMALQDPRLQEPTEIEFIDTPVWDALQFLSDAHELSIRDLGDFDRHSPINLETDAPLSLVLEILAENSGSKWDLLGQTIVFATEEDFPLWEKAIADYRRQQVMITRLNLAGNPLGNQLQKEVQWEFVGTPYIHALDFIASTSKIPLAYTGDVWNQRFKRYWSGGFLGESLTVMLAPHDLSWDTDGQVVLIADRETLKRFVELSAGRSGKRKQATEAIRQALSKPVSSGSVLLHSNEGTEAAAFEELTKEKAPAERLAALDAILKELSKQAGLKIEISKIARQNWGKQPAWLPVKDGPLESVLDLIAAAADGDWKVTAEGGVHIFAR